MAKQPTLKDVLMTQDMGEKGVDKICNAVKAKTFDPSTDVVSAVIVDAFEKNEDMDYDSLSTDLAYAINQLTKAKNLIDAVK